MNGLLDSTLPAVVLDAAVRGTFILLAALAGTALMRRTSAAARHLVWLAALAALLLLPAARAVVPEWRVLPVPSAVLAAPPAPATRAAEAQAPSIDPSAAAAPAAEVVAAPAPAPLRLPVDWKTLALLVWGAGAALLVLRLVYGLARVAWIERRSTELTDDEWVRLTDGLARRLRLGRIVRLLREPGATVPMTWGIFRPVILLPGEADGWEDERRRVVLAHELAHVRRWDALTQWVAHVALAVYWFNPLVWVAVRKLREEREHACDDAVLEIGTRPAEYADHLLNIVRSLGSSHGTMTAALAMARRSQFEGRLLAILDNAVRRNGVSRAAGLATAAAALACLLPLAAMRPAEARAAAAAPAASRLPVSEVRIRAADSGTPAESGEPAAPESRPAERRGPGKPALLGGVGGPVGGLASEREVLGASVAALAAERTELAAGGAGEEDATASAALVQAMERPQDPGLYAEIIRSAEQIESPSHRRLVLTRLLLRPDLSRDNVAGIIGATRTMDSDSERRIVLTGVVAHRAFPAEGPVVAAFVESLRHVASTSEQRIILTALLEQRQLDTPSLVAVLRHVPRIRSDSERRIVMSAIAQRQRVEGAAREAYMAAARSIGSDSERSIVLGALLDPASAPRRPTNPTSPSHPRASGTGATGSAAASRGESLWNATHEVTGTRDGEPRTVRIRVTDALFVGERTNVRGFRPGGSLVVEERLGGRTRVVRATPDAAGNAVWTYEENGRARDFDTAARRWMNGIIREMSS